MPQIQLIITFDPAEGTVGVGSNSPEIMGNPVLTFGMLEAAKMAITKQLQQNENRVQPATILPPGFPVKP